MLYLCGQGIVVRGTLYHGWVPNALPLNRSSAFAWSYITLLSQKKKISRPWKRVTMKQKFRKEKFWPSSRGGSIFLRNGPSFSLVSRAQFNGSSQAKRWMSMMGNLLQTRIISQVSLRFHSLYHIQSLGLMRPFFWILPLHGVIYINPSSCSHDLAWEGLMMYMHNAGWSFETWLGPSLPWLAL